ncbi:hypothetical protein RRG08_054215 [Elysia crispata]|uniref:Uncharacterized protein n=1 Tax=Elysia crispata TaxID=231223 RepID=A0AAE0YC46_9GAST|nr:hypothetical protein RRG08_054215 [Elysia crispata]
MLGYRLFSDNCPFKPQDQHSCSESPEGGKEGKKKDIIISSEELPVLALLRLFRSKLVFPSRSLLLPTSLFRPRALYFTLLWQTRSEPLSLDWSLSGLDSEVHKLRFSYGEVKVCRSHVHREGLQV